jgi:Flp pilus assembly protein TadB
MRLLLAFSGAAGAWFLSRGAGSTSVVVPSGWSMLLSGAATGVTASLGVPLLAAGALGVLVVAIVEQRWRMRRRRSMAGMFVLWPDFLAQARGRIATGEPLPDAVRHAARSLGGDFALLDQPWGGSFSDGLRTAQHLWQDPVADRVLTTLRIATDTGGRHVDAVLSSLALSLADEIRLRRAHEAAVSQQQMTAGVALVAPWLILALSLATNPQAATEFATPTGRFILVAGAGATGLGYLAARRALRLSNPPRVFG